MIWKKKIAKINFKTNSRKTIFWIIFPLHCFYVKHKLPAIYKGISLCDRNMIAFKQSEIMDIKKAFLMADSWVKYHNVPVLILKRTNRRILKVNEVESFDKTLKLTWHYEYTQISPILKKQKLL